MTRQQTLERLAGLLCALERPHPVRAAIDGVDAAGKTILADELAVLLQNWNRTVIRASADGFHNPRAVRYRRGADSPEGYYRDSFDNQAILRTLLIPLGPGGNRRYLRAVFDFRVDAPTHEPPREAPENAILLFDGVFLLRSELRKYWDFSIFVDVDFKVSVPRAAARDVSRDRGNLESERLLAKYNQRYVPGQKLYLAEAQPQFWADVVVDNNDLDDPRLIVK